MGPLDSPAPIETSSWLRKSSRNCATRVQWCRCSKTLEWGADKVQALFLSAWFTAMANCTYIWTIHEGADILAKRTALAELGTSHTAAPSRHSRRLGGAGRSWTFWNNMASFSTFRTGSCGAGEPNGSSVQPFRCKWSVVPAAEVADILPSCSLCNELLPYLLYRSPRDRDCRVRGFWKFFS